MPLVLRGLRQSVTIDPPILLAPMEGITDRVFRSHIAPLGGLGAAVTEFIRISVAPMPVRVGKRDLGAAIGVPVALQLMTPGTQHLAASVANAEHAGAAWIDLNFGCPAPVVFGKCAGSALLAHPERLAAIITTAVAATGLPVTAKLRAGIDSPSQVRELMAACAEAGAAAVTLHARLRTTTYDQPATWAWLATAAEALRHCSRPIPLIGNGGIETASDVGRMRAETGVDAVMVGRAALRDPFIFRAATGAAPGNLAETAAWALRYLDALGSSGPKAKQLVRYLRCLDDATRHTLLRGPAQAIRPWFVERLHAACDQPTLLG